MLNNHSLRPRRARDYGHSLRNFGDTVMESTVLTQYSMAKGLKEFGVKGEEAVMTEIKQLHDSEVIIPVEAAGSSPAAAHVWLK